MTSSPRRRRRNNAKTSLTRGIQSRMPATDLLDIEQLEMRQMLSSAVLTNAQLVDSAVDYLRANAVDFGLVPQDLNEIVVTDQYSTPSLDVNHIYFRQRHGGLDVRNANLNVNLRLDGDFVSAGNRFVSGIWDDSQSIIPRLSAEATLQAAVSHYGWTSEKTPMVVSSASDASRAGSFTAGDIAVQDIRYKLEFVPVDGELELAWTYIIRRPLGEAWYNSSFSADDGRLLLETNWIDHAVYNVLDRPIDSPLYGSQSLVVDPNDRITSPFGWHDLDGIPGIDTFDTSGNNVYAQLDRFGTDQGNGPRASGGVNLEFLGVYNFGANPVTSTDAVTTNLFYWNNLLHDIHYQYGFDEAAGNFQFNNYGNGGLGNDAVRADAQYGARVGLRDNAFFATPPDGENPHMAMMEWTFTLPRRDSTFENTIVVHEFGHGVSNRLTGGPANADALDDVQSLAMGEGWSDFYSLMFNQTSADRANDAYPLGNWILGDDFLFTPGIRRVYYSFDMNIDPHTFATYNASQESHDAGEIWASVLWDLNWFLINGQGPSQSDPNRAVFPGYGFDSDLYHGEGGNNIALQLVMDGMKLQPSNPSFLEARDAILLADDLRYGGANQAAIWTAFARRGMGYSAQDGGSRSRNVVEAFDMPRFSQGVITFDRSTYDVGDKDGIVVRLFDRDLLGSGSVTVTLESDGGDIENVTLNETGNGNFRGKIFSKNPPLYFLDGTLQVRGGDTITVSYRDADIGNGNPAVTSDTATITGGDGGFVTSKTYVSTSTPQALPTNSIVLSTINVPDGFPVGDVNISLNITHPNTNELVVALIGPNDVRIVLADNVGGGGGTSQNFFGTILDDEANDPLTVGVNPFTGSFRPQELLSTFDGISAAGPWKLEISNESNVNVGSLDSWSITIANGNFAPLRFDFGWPLPIQPLARGFVAASTGLYDPLKGYGWQPELTKRAPLMRVDGSVLSRDFVVTPRSTFLVDVPNGIYDVTFYVGDTLEARDAMGLYLEGSLQESVDTARGEVATRTYRVRVADGQMTVGLRDLGERDLFVSLVGLEIQEVDRYQFDFGAAGSPVANGYRAVNASLYSDVEGYGWLPGATGLSAVDRGVGTDLTRDLNLVQEGTFEARVPNGTYEVTIRYGDPLFTRDLMGVFIEGQYRGFVTADAGQVVKVDYNTIVTDGKLTVFFQDLGGADDYVAIIALEIGSPGDGDSLRGLPDSSQMLIASEDSDLRENSGSTSLTAALPSPVADRVPAADLKSLPTGEFDFGLYQPLVLSAMEKDQASSTNRLASLTKLDARVRVRNN